MASVSRVEEIRECLFHPWRCFDRLMARPHFCHWEGDGWGRSDYQQTEYLLRLAAGAGVLHTEWPTFAAPSWPHHVGIGKVDPWNAGGLVGLSCVQIHESYEWHYDTHHHGKSFCIAQSFGRFFVAFARGCFRRRDEGISQVSAGCREWPGRGSIWVSKRNDRNAAGNESESPWNAQALEQMKIVLEDCFPYVSFVKMLWYTFQQLNLNNAIRCFRKTEHTKTGWRIRSFAHCLNHHKNL